MKIIGSRAGNHVDLSTRNAAELRLRIPRFDLNLLGCVDTGESVRGSTGARGQRGSRCCWSRALSARCNTKVRTHSVDGKHVRVCSLSIRGNAGLRIVSKLLSISSDGARREGEEALKVPALH